MQNENVLPQIDRHLLNKWDRKASRVFLHGLEEITPDFGDSWSSDGSFLGEHFVEKSQPFAGGTLPKALIIEAPTSGVADADCRIIVIKND